MLCLSSIFLPSGMKVGHQPPELSTLRWMARDVPFFPKSSLLSAASFSPGDGHHMVTSTFVLSSLSIIVFRFLVHYLFLFLRLTSHYARYCVSKMHIY